MTLSEFEARPDVRETFERIAKADGFSVEEVSVEFATTPTGYMQPRPDGDKDALGRPWPEVKVQPRKARRKR